MPHSGTPYKPGVTGSNLVAPTIFPQVGPVWCLARNLSLPGKSQTKSQTDWVAAVSLGFKGGKRVRRKVQGRTKTEAKPTLQDRRRDLDGDVRSSATYAVGATLDDWLPNGLSGRSDRTKELYRDTVKPLRERLGDVKLRELTAGDVQKTLDTLAGGLGSGRPNCGVAPRSWTGYSPASSQPCH